MMISHGADPRLNGKPGWGESFQWRPSVETDLIRDVLRNKDEGFVPICW